MRGPTGRLCCLLDVYVYYSWLAAGQTFPSLEGRKEGRKGRSYDDNVYAHILPSSSRSRVNPAVVAGILAPYNYCGTVKLLHILSGTNIPQLQGAIFAP